MILGAYSYKINYAGPANQCGDCLPELPVQCTKIHPAKEGNAVHAMYITTLPIPAMEIVSQTSKDKISFCMCNTIRGRFQHQKKLLLFIGRKRSLPFQMVAYCGILSDSAFKASAPVIGGVTL